METIYSKIIWNELDLKDYKIHKEPVEKTENLILEWIESSSLEKVEEVLFELSWFRKVTFESYYDGPFFGFSQREDEVLEKHEGLKSDIAIHDCGMLPSILDMAIKTRMSPSDFIFIAKILEAFWKKVPKRECGIEDQDRWGYKLDKNE